MRSSTILVAALALWGAAPAVAQRRLPVVTESPGARLHDGFYFRFATGISGYDESIRLEGASESTEVSGLSTVSELAIGGTIGSGFVLGGGLWSSSVLGSNLTYSGQMPPAEVMVGSGDFTIFGPFVDWYLDPRHGLHLQGALGVATVRGSDFAGADLDPEAAAIGVGVMFGIGYELWVADEWSFGLLTRLCVVAAAQNDDTNRRWWHAIGSSPSLLFSVTYH